MGKMDAILIIAGLFLFKDQIIKFVSGFTSGSGAIDTAGPTFSDTQVPGYKTPASRRSPKGYVSPRIKSGSVGPNKTFPGPGAAARLAQSWYYPQDDVRLTVG